MTANRIGLAVLAAIAIALGVVHAAIGTRALSTSRAIFDERAVTATRALTWDRAGGAPPVAIELRGEAWVMTSPSPGPVDPAAIADVLGALRGARWQRAASAAPGPVRSTLRVGAESIELGPDVPGAGGWLHRGGRWYLVESWVIAALDRDALSLRPRLPLAAVATTAVERITATAAGLDVELGGAPLALVTPDGSLRLARDVAEAVVGHLAGIHVERLVSGEPTSRPVVLTITVDGRGSAPPIAIEVRGACPDDAELAWIGGATTGEVCVANAPVIAFEAAVRAIAAAPLTYADPRIAVAPPTEVTLLSGAVLTWHGAAITVDARDADDDVAASVVRALIAPAELRRLPTPRPAAGGSITVDGQRFDLLGADTLAAPGSGYGHRVGRDALAALRLRVDELRDRIVLRTEPSLLTSLSYSDSGTREDLPADDSWVQEVAEAVREIRVVGFIAGPPPPARRTIDLIYAPPPAAGAAAETHRLGVGRRLRGGCAGVVDGVAVVLPHETCAVLGKPRGP